jgi:hypothetical protein
MRFRAIEVRPGELLVDEVTVDEAVGRIAGIATVEALLLFASRMALDLFMEGFLADGEDPAGGRELEAAFERELRTMAGVPAEEAVDLRFPVFGPGSLVRVVETVSLDVRYVALDPDTPRQQVWDIERFGARLEEILGRA